MTPLSKEDIEAIAKLGGRVRALDPFGLCIEVMSGPRAVAEVAVERLRRWTRAHRVLVLRGFSPLASGEELAAYARTWGELLPWPFGLVLDIVEKPHTRDAVFDHTYLPLHWDGMYVELIPEFQLFHCVSAPPPGAGGETLFCDTSRVWAHASPATRAQWQRVRGIYGIAQRTHYGGRVVSPLVTEHPVTGQTVLRFNEPVRPDMGIATPHTVEVDGIDPGQEPAFVREVLAALYHPRHMYAHTWQAGDVLIADNYTLLHGRNAFASRAPRHVRRVHILGAPPFRNPALPGCQPGR